MTGRTPARGPTRARSSAAQGSAFVLLAAVQVTLMMAMMVLNVALPEVGRALELDPEQLAVVNSAYPVSFCGLLLLGGRLGDVAGHRRTFGIGVGVFAAASAGAGLATGLGMLLAARFGQGLGAAMAAPAALALVGQVFTEARARDRAVAAWGGFPAAGGALGLLTSGPIVELASWRWVFALPTAVSLLAVACVPLLPTPAPSPRQRVDITGAALATAGLSATCYGLITAGERSWPWTSTAVTVAGVLLLAGFALQQRRARDPVLPTWLIASKRRGTGLICLAAAAAGVFTLSYFLPLHLQLTLTLSPSMTSAVFVPYAVALLAICTVSARVLARLGARVTTVTGLVIGATGLMLLSTIGSAQPTTAQLTAGLIVFPVGAALVFSGAAVVSLEDVPASHSGAAGGLLNAAVEAGPTLGFAVLVSIAAASTSGALETGTTSASVAVARGYGAAFIAAAAGYLIVAALTWGILRSRRASPSPQRRP